MSVIALRNESYAFWKHGSAGCSSSHFDSPAAQSVISVAASRIWSGVPLVAFERSRSSAPCRVPAAFSLPRRSPSFAFENVRCGAADGRAPVPVAVAGLGLAVEPQAASATTASARIASLVAARRGTDRRGDPFIRADRAAPSGVADDALEIDRPDL